MFQVIKLFIVTSILTLSTACSESTIREPETYILPDGYIGSFYIIFNVVDGEPGKEKDGARVYEIPSSGLLLTQMKTNEGWIDSEQLKYYYRKPKGELTQITGRWTTSITDNAEKRADNNLTIFGGSFGTYQQDIKACILVHKSFYIGTKKIILSGGVNNFDLSEIDELKNMTCNGVQVSDLYR